MRNKVYLIRLELAPEDGHALEALARKELRLTHAQASYIIHQSLVSLGLLSGDPAPAILAPAPDIKNNGVSRPVASLQSAQ